MASGAISIRGVLFLQVLHAVRSMAPQTLAIAAMFREGWASAHLAAAAIAVHRINGDPSVAPGVCCNPAPALPSCRVAQQNVTFVLHTSLCYSCGRNEPRRRCCLRPMQVELRLERFNIEALSNARSAFVSFQRRPFLLCVLLCLFCLPALDSFTLRAAMCMQDPLKVCYVDSIFSEGRHPHMLWAHSFINELLFLCSPVTLLTVYLLLCCKCRAIHQLQRDCRSWLQH